MWHTEEKNGRTWWTMKYKHRKFRIYKIGGTYCVKQINLKNQIGVYKPCILSAWGKDLDRVKCDVLKEIAQYNKGVVFSGH